MDLVTVLANAACLEELQIQISLNKAKNGSILNMLTHLKQPKLELFKFNVNIVTWACIWGTPQNFIPLNLVLLVSKLFI